MKKSKRTCWLPPKGASAYFSSTADDEFKEKHPIGYFLVLILGLATLFAPFWIYVNYLGGDTLFNGWMILGFIGSLIIGIGLFNFVSIIVDQYLGHLLSIIAFVLGGILIAISLHFL